MPCQRYCGIYITLLLTLTTLSERKRQIRYFQRFLLYAAFCPFTKNTYVHIWCYRHRLPLPCNPWRPHWLDRRSSSHLKRYKTYRWKASTCIRVTISLGDFSRKPVKEKSPKQLEHSGMKHMQYICCRWTYPERGERVEVQPTAWCHLHSYRTTSSTQGNPRSSLVPFPFSLDRRWAGILREITASHHASWWRRSSRSGQGWGCSSRNGEYRRDRRHRPFGYRQHRKCWSRIQPLNERNENWFRNCGLQ